MEKHQSLPRNTTATSRSAAESGSRPKTQRKGRSAEKVAQLSTPTSKKAVTRPVSKKVAQRLATATATAMGALAARSPQLNAAPAIVGFVNHRLARNRIAHRFGGSLAAHAHGAGRIPSDLDVEVQRGPDVRAAFNTLGQTSENITVNGTVIPTRGHPVRLTEGLSAGVRMDFRTPGGVSQTEIDITNENNQAFNRHLIPPGERGAHAGDGNLVGPGELLVNYLDRMVQKPTTAAAKNDHIQIAHLLLAAGFDPRNPTHADRLRQVVVGLVRPQFQAMFLTRLAELITSAMRARVFG